MTANLKNFEATFLAHGTESNLIVRADDLEQALKAARIKLNMRNLTDCEIIGLRHQGPAHTAIFERDVDLSDPFAVLLQVAMAMQADLSLTLNGETPESVAFFLATKCLEDHGYYRPEAMAEGALRLEEYTSFEAFVTFPAPAAPFGPRLSRHASASCRRHGLRAGILSNRHWASFFQWFGEKSAEGKTFTPSELRNLRQAYARRGAMGLGMIAHISATSSPALEIALG